MALGMLLCRHMKLGSEVYTLLSQKLTRHRVIVGGGVIGTQDGQK